MNFREYLIIYELLGKNRNSLFKLIPLGIVNIAVEMCSLGVVIPFFSIILRQSDSNNYFLNWAYKLFPVFKSFTQVQITLALVAALVLIFILKVIFVIYFNYRLYRLSAEVNNDLSIKLLEGFLNKDYLEFINKNSSILQDIIISDVNQFVGIVQSLIIVSIESLILLAILSFLIYIDPVVAITLSILSLFLIYIPSKISANIIKRMGIERQILSADRIQILNETFSLFREIKLYQFISFFIEKFNSTNSKISNIANKQNTYQQIPRLTLEVLAILVLCSMVLYYIVTNHSPDFILSILAVYALAVFRVLPSITRIINSLQIIHYSSSSIDVIKESLRLDNNNRTSSMQIENFNESLVFNNVSLDINGKNILKNINLEITNNCCIGFYGESGSGKSTIGNIIAGLTEISAGSIFLDGKYVSLKNSNWSNLIAYVQQDYYLIDSSVLKNIALGVEEDMIDYEKVYLSADQAGLTQSISKMSMGFLSSVGERGANLSGGQRQRLVIARALYRNPKILILDEATSALDQASSSVIMEAINSLRGKITIIIISHDPKLINSCDYSYRIEAGEIFK